MAMIKCSECGSNISEKASICPKCGCPIDVTVDSLKRKKKKMRKLILLVIVGVLCLSVLIVLGTKLLSRPDKSGYYQDTKWGMSIEQVKGKIEGNPTINEEKETILNSVDVYDDIQGIEAIELYDCMNDSLCKVTVYLTNTGESTNRDKVLKNADTASVALQYKNIVGMKRADRQALVKGMDVVYIYHDKVDEASSDD